MTRNHPDRIDAARITLAPGGEIIVERYTAVAPAASSLSVAADKSGASDNTK
jgi:hypothetical protein